MPSRTSRGSPGGDRQVRAADEHDAHVGCGEVTDAHDQRAQRRLDLIDRDAVLRVVRSDTDEHDVRTGDGLHLLGEHVGGRGTVARDASQPGRATVTQVQRTRDTA